MVFGKLFKGSSIEAEITFGCKAKMDKVIFCLVTLTVICIGGVSCAKPRRKHLNTDGKIVGGSETDIKLHPYQVSLLLYDGEVHYRCGGSIINQFYILTAAHCLERKKKVWVRVGSTKASSGGTVYEASSDDFLIHPKYDSTQSVDYDAGMIRINLGMNLDGKNAKAIKVAPAGYDPPEGQNMTITGWGRTTEGGDISETLKAAHVPVYERRRCNELLPYTITDRMMCAGAAGTGVCHGDSGGAAVVVSSNKLAGIASFSHGCARRDAPGVFALASNREIRAFIVSTLESPQTK